MFFLQTTSCAALFYAIRQFYAIAIFVMDGLFPGRDGVEVMEVAVELARKAVSYTHLTLPTILLV